MIIMIIIINNIITIIITIISSADRLILTLQFSVGLAPSLSINKNFIFSKFSFVISS